MDRLPVPVAITGLLSVAGSAIDMLWDLNIAPLTTTAVINLALRELKECRSSIQALHKLLCLLDTGATPFPERAAWIGVDEVVATLTDAILSFSRLYALCCTIEDAAVTAGAEELSRRYEKRLKALCARIRWHNLSIAMMMTIVNCPSEKDAKNSREELSHRVTRLLTCNIGLAARMRRGQRPLSRTAHHAKPAVSPEAAPGMSAESAPPTATSTTHHSQQHQNHNQHHSQNHSPRSSTSTASTASTASTIRSRASSASASSFVLSSFTLANINVLAAVALPVAPGELRGDGAYYEDAMLPPSPPAVVSMQPPAMVQVTRMPQAMM